MADRRRLFDSVLWAAVGWALMAPMAAAIPGKDQPSDLTHTAAGPAAAFGLPNGFSATLFAAEPFVQNPVAFSIDEQGRVFVCETFRQEKGVTDNRGHDRRWVEADLAARSVEDRIAYHRRLLGKKASAYERHEDRVRRLLDDDGDGVADRVDTYSSGYRQLEDGTAAGVLARRGTVYLTCIPGLYLLRDAEPTSPEADASTKELLSTGYGVRVAYRGHDLHGLAFGPDGRLYFTIGDRGYRVVHEGQTLHDPGSGAVFRCDLDGKNLEVFARGLRNPQEIAFDDLGNLFTVDNNSDAGDKARLVHLVPGAEVGWNMAYQYLKDRGPWMREKICELERDDQPAWILPPLAHVSTGPSGFCAYPGTGLTPHFDGRFLLADFRGGPVKSCVRTFRLAPRGGSFEVHDDEETFRNVLATDVEIGPDGAVWVSDWVEGWFGEGKGRIWRFVPEDRDERMVAEVQGLLAGDWTTVDVSRLLDLLGHADRRIRLEAQWELARRGAATPLESILGDASAPRQARVHAAQGLGQLLRRSSDPLAATALMAACSDGDAAIRQVAARAIGDSPTTTSFRAALRRALARGLADVDLHVVVAAATSLGRLGRLDGDEPAPVAALLALAESPQVLDRTVRHAAVMGLAGAASPDEIEPLIAHPTPQVRLIACVVLRRLDDPRLARLLDDADVAVAIEAARAIHDRPITDALPSLAHSAAGGPADDAFLRRAVSAAETVGTPTAIDSLMKVIARGDASSEARGEAIDAIGRWSSPPRVNRVTGEWMHGVASRDAEPARRALATCLAQLLDDTSLPESLHAELMAAAGAIGLDEVWPMIRVWALDTRRSAASRARAVDALRTAGDADRLTIAERLVTDPEPLVRMAARRARVAASPTAAVVPDLVAACAGPDMAERQQAVTLLLELSDPAATEAITALATQLEAGTLDPTIALEVAEAAEMRLGQRPLLGTSNDPLAAWQDVAAGGDPKRGRHLFTAKEEVSCVRCHSAEGTGGDVGPRLDGIASRRDPRYLLESIVHPNARVAEGYATTVILTDEGLAHSGVITSETPESITMRLPDGTTRVIPAESVDERSNGPSAMPGDIADKLTRRELRDIVAWLQSLL